MGKSGIISIKNTGKDNEAYHDIITLLKIYRKRIITTRVLQPENPKLEGSHVFLVIPDGHQ